MRVREIGSYMRVTTVFWQSVFFLTVIGGIVVMSSTAFAQEEEKPSKEQRRHAVIKKHLRDAGEARARLKGVRKSFRAQEASGQELIASDHEFIAEMKRHARDRSRALEDLIESDPAMALEIAITPEERAQFPAAVREDLEEDVDLEGELEVAIEDNFEEGTSKTHHALVNGNKRYSLHFVEEPQELLSGSEVRVKGLRAGKRVAVPGKEGWGR